MSRVDVTFLSAGTTCAAWHYTGQTSAFETEAGRPCVVMAHGFSGTRDAGLEGYAEGFAAAGFDVLLFDYRGFGGSQGAMRQHIDYRGQRADYHAAAAASRGLAGVDPDKIVLWGTSYSGGHVLNVAAHDQRIAAVLSLTPAVDGVPVLGMIIKSGGIGKVLALSGAGLRDRFGRPQMLPAVGPAGSSAVIAKDGALENFLAVAGPSWRNEVRARCTLDVALNRPVLGIRKITAPLLIQVGDNDTVVSTPAAVRAARKATAFSELRNYPVDHFDVYGDPWLSTILHDQIEFLSRRLGTSDQTQRNAS
ncbi:alpha/beta hydrolase [Streptomyces sp. NPDC059083]|uniref:alpha/beta hydrolase n=1 Tax=Streptomyces sp. NPDC059083 TaxID=3346721 RepID=UPI0036A59175